AQKYDAEMHKRQEEEERLAAKKSREGTAGADKKKKGTVLSNGKGKKAVGTRKPGTAPKPAAAVATGKSEVIGSRKVVVPVAAAKTVAVKSTDSLKKSDGALKKSDNTLNMGSFPKLPQKTRASNAWTAA
ncbi:UNVERIFIED_CONTAM: hypothetical protein HDU68_002164, partial [Siphonaria sp. JEL0065]